MAKTNTGVLGVFTGFIRNGQNILRTSTSSIKNKRTPLQLAQRERSIPATLYPCIYRHRIFNKSFPAYGHTGSGYNRVMSALMSHAVTDVYPDMALNYPQVLVSKGRLPGAELARQALRTARYIFFCG